MKKLSLIILIGFLFLEIAIPASASSVSCYLNFTGESIGDNGNVSKGKSFNAEVYIKGTASKGSGISTIINYDSSKLDIGAIDDITSSFVDSAASVNDTTITIGSIINSDLVPDNKVMLAKVPITAKEDIDNVIPLIRINSQEVVKGGEVAQSNIVPPQINNSRADIPLKGEDSTYTYNPMEKIPGTTEDISYFPDYIKAIYKFAIWAIGIAALLMISVGGFMYFSAAGNTSKLEKAKVVIRDAIFGIIAVLMAYLILYVINPDLVNVSLESLSNLKVK